MNEAITQDKNSWLALIYVMWCSHDILWSLIYLIIVEKKKRGVSQEPQIFKIKIIIISV